jgi:hypothetical protein
MALWHVMDQQTKQCLSKWLNLTGQEVLQMKGGHEDQPSIRIPGRVEEAHKILLQSPKKSMSKLSQQMRKIYSNVRKIYQSDLSAYHYKIQFSQPLTLTAKGQHFQFATDFSALFE